MNTTPIECIGLACVRIDVDVELATTAVYVFANGFDTGTPEGATAGANPISIEADGSIIVFLSEPVAPGIAANQGGVVAVAQLNARNNTAPGVAWATVEYSPVLGGAYANVDPQKAIRIVPWGVVNQLPAILDADTDIVIGVYRNVQTLY